MAVTKSELTATKSELAHLTENTNNIRSEMETTKSVMKSDMARLTGKIDNIQSEMKSDIARLIGKIDNVQSGMANLSNNLTTQMKSFIETVSAQTGVLNANFDLKLAKFENRFYFRMFWAVSDLFRICYILLSNHCEGIWSGGFWSEWYLPTKPDSCYPDSYRPDSRRPDSCRPDSCRPDFCGPGSCGRTELKQERILRMLLRA